MTPQHRAELLAMGCVEPGTELAIDDSPKPIPPMPLARRRANPDDKKPIHRGEVRRLARKLRREMGEIAAAVVQLQRRTS